MLSDPEPRTTVVVCEDDAPTLELLCDNLEADRYRGLPAPSASDALHLCHYKQPEPAAARPATVRCVRARGAAGGSSLRRRDRSLRPRAAGDHPERTRHRGRPDARLRRERGRLRSQASALV
jgi:hypothetical protein